MSRSLNNKTFKSMPDEFIVISDTEAHIGKFAAIVIVETPTFSLTGNTLNDVEDKDLSGLDDLLDQGFELLGNWTSVKLSSGVVIAYMG